MGAAYSQLDNGTFEDHSQLFALQEYTTDEAILPTRGSDWGDGGIYRALHEFTWAPDHSMITNTWNNLNSGMQLSLAAISSITKSDLPNKAQMLAEAEALLALYTFQTLDLYGQAPYRDANDTLRVTKAATGIDDLIKTVESIIPDLLDMGQNKLSNGRFSKQAAYALLADMYLNRAVYKDRYASAFKFDEPAVDNNGTDMDKVISYTSLLINGKFKLDSNFFHNFDIENGDAHGTDLC